MGDFYFNTMAKSRKLPIWKDGKADEHRLMRRRIRRTSNLKVKDILSLIDKESYEIPNPHSIVNDYDWSDYTIDYRDYMTRRYRRHKEPYDEFVRRALEMINKLSRK